MKDMKDIKIKKIIQFGLLMELLLLILLTVMACSASTETTQPVDTTETQTDEAVLNESEDTQNNDTILEENAETVQTENISEKEAEYDDNYGRKRAMAAYRQALTQLYEKQIFPDGTEAEYYADYYDISENQFAVYDIDLDDRDELIILYTTCSMAGMTAYIYDYDETTNSLYSELRLFPSLRFYDNAVIEEDISHNQGYAGDFWPYTLYSYDKENDTYQAVIYADAWNRSLSEVDYDGNTFPAEADEDEDGIVYYITPYGDNNYDEPIDWDAYETWHTSTVGNAIEIPYKYLTPEHIAALK